MLTCRRIDEQFERAPIRITQTAMCVVALLQHRPRATRGALRAVGVRAPLLALLSSLAPVTNTLLRFSVCLALFKRVHVSQSAGRALLRAESDVDVGSDDLAANVGAELVAVARR